MDLRSCYGALLMGIMQIMGRDAAKKFDVWFRFHKRINLKEPATLRDKVIFIENHCPSPLAAKCTDKWEVRAYVASKGYQNILVPVYGEAYRSFDDIPFDTFPERFVLKATHGCKMNYFCTNKAQLNMQDCRKALEGWLETTYGTYSGEWHYFDIPHRIYCEQYLDDADKMVDYKFHCMNGVPQFVLVCGDRDASEAMRVDRHIFDMEWNQLEGLVETDKNRVEIRPPQHFSQMVEIAKKLSGDFEFVRVDLYEIDGKVYFGELTFTPTGGVFSHYTDTFLREMGAKLTL